MLLQNEDVDDFEDMDQRDWIMDETELESLTQKQKMNSRAVELCEKVHRERIAVAETTHGLEQREPCTAAVPGDLSDGQQTVCEFLARPRRATLSV